MSIFKKWINKKAENTTLRFFVYYNLLFNKLFNFGIHDASSVPM